jgi:hypothetical protein
MAVVLYAEAFMTLWQFDGINPEHSSYQINAAGLIRREQGGRFYPCDTGSGSSGLHKIYAVVGLGGF